MDIMTKVQGIKAKFEELKTKLDKQTFTQQSTDGTVTITLTELATVKDIKIASGLLADQKQLEDTLVVTLNKALDRVKENAIEEAKKTLKDNVPQIPGLPI